MGWNSRGIFVNIVNVFCVDRKGVYRLDEYVREFGDVICKFGLEKGKV